MANLEGHRPVSSPARLEGHSDLHKDNKGREHGGKATPGPSTGSDPIKANLGQS